MAYRQSMRSWAGEQARTIFGVYLVALGLVVVVAGNDRLQGPGMQGIRESANFLRVGPSLLIFFMTVTPGLLIIVRRTRKYGLLWATMTCVLLAVVFVRSFLASGQTSPMAAITYAFVALYSAWLYTTERFAT